MLWELATAFVAGHLWVVGSFPGADGKMARYPLHDGVPASNPDLRYPHYVSSLFAIALDGSLFTFVYHNDERIAVFAPNSTRIVREVHIPAVGSYDPSINGLSVDGLGSTYFSWVSTGSLRPIRETSSYCPGYGYGVIVYPPNARGHTPYSSCFRDAQAYMEFAGIAVDSLGSLYLPNLGSVLVYGSAAKDPRLIRTVSGESFQGATGVALDRADRMWVIDTTTSGYSYVASYRRYASGKVQAERTIAYPTRQQWFGNIAVDDKFLYIGGNAEVLVYDKYANGRALPLATLDVPTASGGSGPWIAIGP
jgi:hypothetical protein